jgi:glutathione synthase/RimK-type ligase-like ATP-grasp enzyme
MNHYLEARIVETLQRISDVMALDYGGIDFAIDRDGRVVVFECS